MRKTRIILSILIIAMLLGGCGTIPTSTSAVLEIQSSGIDPDSWALVPAGPFVKGQQNDEGHVDYDYEIMVTEVTNNQYAKFLKEALIEVNLFYYLLPIHMLKIQI